MKSFFKILMERNWGQKIHTTHGLIIVMNYFGSLIEVADLDADENGEAWSPDGLWS